MSKNILYLCPSFPYPADSGGKVAFLNHIDFLKRNNFDVHTVFFDVDNNASDSEAQKLATRGFKSYRVFSRTRPRVTSLKTLIISVFFLIFSKRPRAFDARVNKEIQQYIFNLLENYKFDYILFDHFTAFAFINNYELLATIKKIYVAHNVESKVLKDQYKHETNLFKKLFHYIEYLKTYQIEKMIFEIATGTIAISSEDHKILFESFSSKGWMQTIPEILPLKSKLWQYRPKKNILFVGGTDYYPNHDAVCWMVFKLMPELLKLDQEITLSIVGNSDNFEKGELPSNVFFTGKISDEELDSLYQSSNLFISPVILGSGIKVKVLTALSYTIPLLCTKESMHGIDYVSNQEEILFDRQSLMVTVQRVTELLNDEKSQQEMAYEIEKSIRFNFNHICKKWDLNNV